MTIWGWGCSRFLQWTLLSVNVLRFFLFLGVWPFFRTQVEWKAFVEVRVEL